MTRSSRDKLNAIYGVFIIAVAAVFGAIAGSWVLFVLIAAGLFAVAIQTGLIRLADDRTHRRRK